MDTSTDNSAPKHTQVGHAHSARITEMVSAQAATGPERLAVEHRGTQLSYGELESRAEYLAEHLRSLGVGPEVVVGLYIERSIAMVVGALAIMKAGGAYLPIDPAYPGERATFQLLDAEVPVVLSAACLISRLPEGPWQVVGLDPVGRFVSAAPIGVHPALPKVNATDLAYVIYTSGSTGKPKGVEIVHASLENLVSWHQQAFAVSALDRASLQSSPGFDAAVWELWPYLTAGAGIHIADESIRSDPGRYRDWLVEKKVTIAFAPTAMAEALMRIEWPVSTSLRILLTGADTLRHCPPETLPFALVNNYGPTECTVVTTSGVVCPTSSKNGLPPIGRPISNAQVFILDESLQELPSGEPGHLYIGGAGLARGYRNRPDLTAQQFISNPWVEPSGSARLYRTGDIATYLPDGQLSFLGRSDDQVKIRGYRIELDEVAAAMDCHPAVHVSVAVAVEENEGEKQLIGYVVLKQGERLADRELREHLLLTLPEYMVPAGFFRLDTLPLNASGKVDRKALPPLSMAERLSEEVYVAPGTPVELRVAALLAGLLHFDKVGANDNFFLIGGNSLLGAQVIARIRDAFGVDLSLLSLFDNPTVTGLASEIEGLLIAQIEEMSEEDAERFSSFGGDMSRRAG